MLQSGEDARFEHAHEYIEQQRSELAALWAARAAEVAKTSFKADGHVVLPTDTNDVSSYTEVYVHLGGVIRIPIHEDTVSLKIGYPADRQTPPVIGSGQYLEAVCRILSFCRVDDGFGIDLSHKKTLLRLSYIEIAISMHVPALFSNRRSVEFELRLQLSTGEVRVTHYSLDSTLSRQKRSRQYTAYATKVFCAIPWETYFPNYWQHDIKTNCPVGCGPVAWAMIFGYYDRRSHYKSSTFGTGSRDLFRCGSDGTTGSNGCVAPVNSNNDKIKKYTEKIAKTLGTWCIFKNGATPVYKMDRIEDFFKVFTLIVHMGMLTN